MMGFYLVDDHDRVIDKRLTTRWDEDTVEALFERLRLSIGQCSIGCAWCQEPTGFDLVWADEQGQFIHRVRGVTRADIMGKVE